MKRTLLSLACGAVLLSLDTGARAGFPNLDKLGESLKKVEDAADKTKDTRDKVGRVAKGATGLSLEEEIAIGDAVALEIVGKFGGLDRDPEATRRLNTIGKALARYAVRQDLIWRFGLLDSDEINAFSAPGGRVFITRGLYRMARSDDELAAILAHEIEHVDRRHALKIIARGEMIGGVSELVAERSSDFAEYEKAVGDVVRQILDKGYDPNTEYEADAQGRALAKTTGFAPGGLRAVLDAIKASQAGQAQATLSTHPPLKERLKRLPKDPPPPVPEAEASGDKAAS